MDMTLDVRAMPLYHASTKRADVEEIIDQTAQNHAAADFFFNVAGYIPIPGSGLIGAAASIAAQAPLFYKPMVTKIAGSYMRPLDATTNRLVSDTAWLGAEYDIATEFGVEFFTSIVGEIIAEAGMGWAASKFIPIIGPLLSGGMDAVIASTLTWRVGVAAAIYYENGLGWTPGGRNDTYGRAKGLVGGFNADTKRVDLNSLRSKVPEVKSSSIKTVMELAKMLRGFSIPVDQIRRKLTVDQGIDEDIVDAVLHDLR